MSYKKPSLQEVFIELFLEKGCFPPDKVLKVSEDLKIALPKMEFGTLINPAGMIQRICFRRSDEQQKRLVQIAEDFLVINQTKGYLGWAEVMKLFSSSLEVLLKYINRNNIKAISFNAADQFSLIEKEFVFNNYFNCDGNFIPKYYSDSKVSLDLSYGQGLLFVDGFNLGMNISIRRNGQSTSGNINFTLQQNIAEKDDVSVVLNNLKNKAGKLFEDMITDRYRDELMGGKTE